MTSLLSRSIPSFRRLGDRFAAKDQQLAAIALPVERRSRVATHGGVCGGGNAEIRAAAERVRTIFQPWENPNRWIAVVRLGSG